MRSVARLASLLLLLMAVSGVLPIVATAAPGEQTVRASLTVDGRERAYLLHVPPGYDGTAPLPLVLLLHGAGGDGAGMERLTKFDAVADAQNALVVYPDGVGRRWAGEHGYTAAETQGVDDVAFLGALLDDLAARYTVDARRVYVAGISNGGFMAGRLACDLPDRFAAVGIVASSVIVPVAQNCSAGSAGSAGSVGSAVPVILMHGTEDPIVPVVGSSAGRRQSAFLSTADSVAFWVNRNGCASTPMRTDLADIAHDGTQVRQDTYGGCRDGAEVIYDEITGAGHTWPGGVPYLPARLIGKTTSNLDGSAALWGFFAAHAKS